MTSYYTADLVSATDYSPFGAPLAGRTYTAPNISYRFGFNGKENDDETQTMDYGMRIYDKRLGRFLSVDPLAKEYAWNSTYAFAENDVICNIDLDGQEKYHYTLTFDKNGKTQLKYTHQEDIIERVWDWGTFSFKTVVNKQQQYVVHTGQFHEGAVNGTLYKQEIIFEYSNASKFVEEAAKLTQQDIDDENAFLTTGDRIAAGLQNVSEERLINGGSRGRLSSLYKSKIKVVSISKSKYPQAAKHIETPNPAGHELVYQGFISKNTTGKYEWVANLNPNGTEHQSVAKLRKRAEAFAHFWYQIQNNQQAIGGVLWGGNYENNWVILKFAADLLKNNSNKIIRFEREGHLSLNFELSNYLNGNYTDSSELDYVLDVFLEYVKSNFQIEQTKNNY